MDYAGIGSLHCAEKTGTRNVVWSAGQKAMETKSVKVSIIIPVYNVAPYIGDCIQSVMRQTYKGEMECLLIDDCGEDDSIAIAEKMIREYNDNEGRRTIDERQKTKDDSLDDNEGRKTKDDNVRGRIRFKILRHERNRGLSAARNTGTHEAKGDYLFYLDSDDEITDDCIEKLMQRVIEDPDIEMVLGSVCRHRMNGESVISPERIVLPLASSNEEVRKCFYQYGQIYVNVWNKLLKRRVIIENNILCKEGLLYEDNLWVFYLLKYVKKAAFVSDITYHKNIRPQSITTSTDEKTRWYHFNVIYRDIMNNLTPGHEQQECNYYGVGVAGVHVRYVRMVPECKEVLQLCQENCKQYGSRYLQMILAVSSVLGKYRYGYTVWRCLMWGRRKIKRH